MAISARAVAQGTCHGSNSDLGLCGSYQTCKGGDGACRLAMRRSVLYDGGKQLAAACFEKCEGSGRTGQRYPLTNCRMPDGHDSPFLDWAFNSCYKKKGDVSDEVVHRDSPSDDDSFYSSFREAVDRASISEEEVAFSKNFNRLSSQGVGPIARDYVAPERGCVLIATRKLDGHSLYSRSVILLLGRAEDDEDVVRGLVLNKPLPPAISKGLNPMRGISAHCAEAIPVHMGGPLQSTCPPVSVLASVKGLRGFGRLIPDIFLGDEAVLQNVAHSCNAGYMKPTDARVFVGAVEWRLQDLLYQIEVSEWWEVAEGRSHELRCFDSAEMWESLDIFYSRDVKPESICRDEGHVSTEESNLTERAV